MQDYKFVQRALTPGPTEKQASGEIIVQNVAEFLSYLNEMYLAQGYKVHTITNLPADPNRPQISQFVYHLVKDVE